MDAANKFVFVLALALVLASANADQWCDRTSNAALCHSIVSSDPRPRLKITYEGVGTIFKDKAISTVVSTAHRIYSLIATTRNKRVVQVLKTCARSYSRVMPSLTSADFYHYNYIHLVQAFSDGGDAGHECKTSFQEPGVGRSPIEEEVQSLIDICANALEIVNLRQCHSPTFCS